MDVKALKNARAKKLGNLTRIRRRAFIIIDAKGSRTQLSELLKDLDQALEAIQELNEEYASLLKEDVERESAEAYMKDVEKQYQDAVSRIEEHLVSRKDEAPSVASGSQVANSKSTASDRARIVAKVKRLEVEQLGQRLELQRQEQVLQSKRQLQEAEDAREAAELEAKLLCAAEDGDDLNKDRMDDFVGEPAAQGPDLPPRLSDNPLAVGGAGLQPSNDGAGLPPPNQCPSTAGVAGHGVPGPGVSAPNRSENDPATDDVTNRHPGVSQQPQIHGNSEPLLHCALPRLTLPKFDGNPGEWVKWFALFRTLVHDQETLTATEKMIHLQSAVTGLAQQTIKGLLYNGSLYGEAIKMLQERFGRQEDIVSSTLEKVFSCPSPSLQDPISLERFQSTIHCAIAVFESMGYQGDLDSFENLRRVVQKLPPDLMKKWSEHVLSLEPARPSLLHLDTWLRRQVRIALNFAAVSKQPGRQPTGRRSPNEGRKQGGAMERTVQRTALVTEAQPMTSKSCICCEALHDVSTCPTFLSKPVDERAILVSRSGACFFCLRKGHAVRNCRFAKRCGIEGCRMRHHRSLHGSKKVGTRAGSQASGPELDGQRVVAAASLGGEPVTTLLQVVQVTVVGKGGKTRKVCALLDPGSQTSLVAEDVVEELGLEGEQQTLQLRNVEGSGSQQHTRRLQLQLITDGEEAYSVSVPEAFSVREINLTVPHFPVKHWQHVQGLRLPDCRGRKIELLLGANVLEAVLQLEVRTGSPGDPVAIRTIFGWTLTGSVSGLVPGQVRDVMLIHRATEESVLCDAVKDWWATESFGSMFEGQVSRSQDDLRAQAMLDKMTKLQDGHYEVGLLWKKDDLKMPDNRRMAERRLQSLERSLSRDPAKAAAYEDVLMGYVTKNHARKVSPEELSRPSERRWLLPHHAVSNPNKTKVRVVFDAAARCKGTSLNDALITGPDLLQNLVGVLIRFRRERVALVADVEQMFHQVRVRVEDQPALSFLWRHMDSDRPPDVYQMMVVIFGARCSPTLANYALRRTAEDHEEDTDESRAAAAVVKHNFYMDDLLVSVPDVQEAKKMRTNVAELVAKGGFRLTKWTTNKPEVLQDVPADEMSASGLDLASLGQGTQRALGCVWRPGSDVLGVKVTDMDVPATKRGVLSRLSMIFDPLGIVSPFVLRAKLLVQHLWKLKLDWDCQLSGEELMAWENWLSEMPHLEDIEIQRCYKADVPPGGEVTGQELHVFCDASQKAFGAVAYLRMSCADGTNAISFIASRTRLAPLKQLTIVRLELQAAVLGVRLANFVKGELSCSLDEVFLWTDSSVVLRFLRNESRRFHTFVANRIAEIQDSSEAGQWHHVPGELNPADVCSRGMSGPGLQTCSLWWSGPEFLTKGREEWPPEHVTSSLSAEDAEVKTPREVVFAAQISEGPLVDPSRYSSWVKYKRTVAWILRFCENTRRSRRGDSRVGGALTSTEIQSAEVFILRELQRATYHAELKAIASGSRLPEDSTLLHLSPYVDEQGLLRARGRLRNAPLAETCRHPLLISKNDDVIRLIVTDVHRRALHAGLEQTLSELRLSYWVPKARSTTRKIIHRCAYCWKRRTQPQTPMMADLPASRFDMSRPFACVGLDYCGPLTVRKFRKTEKRYVLLITCLATRALHLELVSSMDTDGFLMALRRFIARRGRPRVIWSDNGSNLVAGEKELRSCLEAWNQTHITDELSQRHIEWHFNPPTASHMGGVWERLVAMVKRALLVVLGNQCVSEDVLHTVLVEVEFTINSRPLTYVSSDINDPEPLTPNHFVLGSPQAAFPPGMFTDSDALGRGKWRQSQVLADQLWRRWQREYLPMLIQRKKWVHEGRDLQVGDVVLMVEQGSPRGYWPLAKVTEATPGGDGRVRAVTVQTSGGSTYRRPANKICFLESCVQSGN